jgi:hypothetical protein
MNLDLIEFRASRAIARFHQSLVSLVDWTRCLLNASRIQQSVEIIRRFNKFMASNAVRARREIEAARSFDAPDKSLFTWSLRCRYIIKLQTRLLNGQVFP